MQAALAFQQGAYQEALKLLEKALQLHPDSPASVRQAVGACYLRLGDMARARAAYTRAVQLDSRSVDALVRIAASRSAPRAHAPACWRLRCVAGGGAVPGAAPGEAADARGGAQVGLAICEAGAGERGSEERRVGVQAALRALKAAFQADPGNAATLVLLAELHLSCGDLKGAEELAAAAWHCTDTPALRAAAAVKLALAHQLARPTPACAASRGAPPPCPARRRAPRAALPMRTDQCADTEAVRGAAAGRARG